MLNELCRYFICFMVFSFIGWVYESVFYSVQLKRFVNSGFLHGCICPIYGLGGMLLMPFAAVRADLRVIFILGAVLCSALEYFISWLLEYLFDTRWWDYSDWPMNLNGRICAVSVVGFGFAALIGTQLIIPAVFDTVSAMNNTHLYSLAALIALVLAFDLNYTLRSINRSGNEPWFVEEHSQLMEKRVSELNERLKRFIRK
ncbi:MAG: putative ABC transporter permease [bacterium]|nr:putative ABC transporter permease [bacterium]